MSINPSAPKISTLAELENVVALRARHIAFASKFLAWPNETSDFYSFLAPNSSGIHVCERVYHPGASSLVGHEDLCDLILGGSEATFELTPQYPQAVRFCEKLLATLYEEEESRKIAHLPFAQELLISSDWSVKDGIGPCSLHSPSVIGYSDPKNLNKYSANKPAVIWSKFWQLSTDPIDCLLKRIGQIIEEHSRSLKPSSSYKYAPATMDAWIDRAVLELRPWIEARRKLPTIGLNELTYTQLPNLPGIRGLKKEQIENVCNKLGVRFREKNIYKDWLVMFRAPASSMYDKASLSFANSHNVLGDCWGYPFAFDLTFGNGVVSVRCEGVPTPAESDDEGAPGVVTSRKNTQKPMPTEWLTISEAAEYAGKTTKTIRSWLQRKIDANTPMLPHTAGSGRMVRILRADLDMWRKST